MKYQQPVGRDSHLDTKTQHRREQRSLFPTEALDGNLRHYYSSQFILVASDTVLTHKSFDATINQYTYIKNDKVAAT